MMTDDTTLTISRLIAAPTSAVWNAWSVPENLAKWHWLLTRQPRRFAHRAEPVSIKQQQAMCV